MEDPHSASPTTQVQSYSSLDNMILDGSDSGERSDSDRTYTQSSHSEGSQSSSDGPGSIGTNQRTRNPLRLQNFGWNSFLLMDIIGTGRSGVVYQADFRKERVAIKICDIWQNREYHKEMLTETRTYLALSRLQGGVIPRLKGAGYTAGGLFALITELAGSPIDARSLNNQECALARQALVCIHKCGYLHGDIRPSNILLQYCGGRPKVMFVNFTFAKCFFRIQRSRGRK